MNHIIKDIPFNGKLININDEDLIKEWNDWHDKKQKNPTNEIFEEGKILYDKFRKRYGINTCISIGHLKDNPTQLAMTVSDISVKDTIYHDSESEWSKKQ